MTLTELKYVIAVARMRHFGRAAESCFVSQPSLSVAIRKLEEELGVTIFERRTSDISITPIGQQIVEQAQRVLDESRRIIDIAQNGHDPLAAPLRLGVILTIAPYLLPNLLTELSDSCSQMPLYLEESFTDELLEKLRSGQIDAAIMADTIHGTGMMTETLYQEEFVVAVPSHHPWVNRNFVNADELKDQTMLLLGSGHCRDLPRPQPPRQERSKRSAAHGRRLEPAHDLPHGRAGARHYGSARLGRSLSYGPLVSPQDPSLQATRSLAPRHSRLA